MRRQLLPLLRCPACGGRLELEGPAGDWIMEGALRCAADGRTYPIIAGMPRLYVDDARWAPKAREAEGWVRFHKDRGIYEQTGVDIDFQLPYFPHEPWIEIARQFDIALKLINPRPGMRVLDVGAGRGWAAKHLALRGCDAVAIEVNADDQVGLGRANAMMEQAGVRFDALIGDSENMPFASGSFDLVFAAAALHHTSDLGLLLENIARVLRPGGRMVAMNEPCIADDTTDEAVHQSVAEELSYGINENHPRIDGYRRALAGAGLREQALFVWQAYAMTPAEQTQWSSDLGVPPPAAFTSRPNPLARILQRLRGGAERAHNGTFPQAWMDHLLRRRGAVVIIAATRP